MHSIWCRSAIEILVMYVASKGYPVVVVVGMGFNISQHYVVSAFVYVASPKLIANDYLDCLPCIERSSEFAHNSSPLSLPSTCSHGSVMDATYWRARAGQQAAPPCPPCRSTIVSKRMLLAPSSTRTLPRTRRSTPRRSVQCSATQQPGDTPRLLRAPALLAAATAILHACTSPYAYAQSPAPRYECATACTCVTRAHSVEVVLRTRQPSPVAPPTAWASFVLPPVDIEINPFNAKVCICNVGTVLMSFVTGPLVRPCCWAQSPSGGVGGGRHQLPGRTGPGV